MIAYSREFLARVAGELDSRPTGAAIEQMLADYQVMRDQARACARLMRGSAGTSRQLLSLSGADKLWELSSRGAV